MYVCVGGRGRWVAACSIKSNTCILKNGAAFPKGAMYIKEASCFMNKGAIFDKEKCYSMKTEHRNI